MKSETAKPLVLDLSQVGAGDVENGNFHYFDNREVRLDARHVMASGALPPGLVVAYDELALHLDARDQLLDAHSDRAELLDGVGGAHLELSAAHAAESLALNGLVQLQCVSPERLISERIVAEDAPALQEAAIEIGQLDRIFLMMRRGVMTF